MGRNYNSLQRSDFRVEDEDKQNSGVWTENERQGLKTSTWQCRRLPSGLVADVERDALMRCMKMRGFSEDGINQLFKEQRVCKAINP
ncbi:MAG: hypothetical protein EZS28_005990 [Streblomastix strix]|uniref:Uncharacterized protein n=1 Tax=Streblomastix strix TaxID=222440 RepID=A0A5J4WUK5_9EUKA|nr:MAG: hypothetical protein EZS28_005990 [Streblomastix strix]